MKFGSENHISNGDTEQKERKEPVRGHLFWPSSPMEYLWPTTLDIVNLGGLHKVISYACVFYMAANFFTPKR